MDRVPSPPPPLPPAAGRRGKRLLLLGLVAGGVVFAGLWILGFVLYLTHEDPDFIADESFIKAANQRCAAAHREFDAGQPADEHATDHARAQAVDTATRIFAGLSADLQALEPRVAAEDAPAVRRWLAEWDEFVAVGPEYAAAIRRGNRAEIDRIGDKGDKPASYINDFAEANDMPECVF